MIYVLCSGGLDSLAHLHWAVMQHGKKNVCAITYTIGQRYEAKEVPASRLVSESYGVEQHIVPLTGLSEQLDGHVPWRNLTFIFETAKRHDCYAVVFGMLKGESSEDKNPKFCRRLERLIRSQLELNHYGGGREFALMTPFEHATKTQLLSWFLGAGGSRALAEATVSCYSSRPVRCGRCQACFNRWVAYVNNGILQDYEADPMQWYSQQVQKWREAGYKHWRGSLKPSRAQWLFEVLRARRLTAVR